MLAYNINFGLTTLERDIRAGVSDDFIKQFEEPLGRILEKQPVGRPRKLNPTDCSTEDLFGQK